MKKSKAADPLDLLKTGGGAALSAEIGRTVRKDALLGREFSGYRLTAHIADGGMGKVYRAVRADGRFERDVAVKVSVAGQLDDALRDRFLQEQQILASLNHPHIAQLYDAGISEEGWPYIVMELVDGTPIDEHCAQLSVDEKVALVEKVCRALSFAHAQLIVHRDIKPGNVLVTDDGEPKLLDFGIAKTLSESTPVTRVASLTPRYASPEQLLGKPAGVASDIYQVGLLLAGILDAGLVERDGSLEEAIRRASSGGGIALDPDASRSLPRELVSIIQQCVRTSPAERYAQVSEVRDDLVNYLEGFPVRASGNSPLYLARKFIRRNMAYLATAAVVVIAFVASGAWYLMEVNNARERAELEAATSQEVTAFLAGLFRSSSPSQRKGAEITAGKLLERGLERLDEDLGDQPRVRAQLQSVLGSVYHDMGNGETARELLTQALEVQERNLGRQDPATVATLDILANVALAEGSFEEAERLFNEILRIRSNTLGPTHEETLSTRSNLASVYRQNGDFAEAARVFREIVDGHQANGQLASEPGIAATTGLAIATIQSGDPQGSIPYFEQALELSREVHGPRHIQTISAIINMAVVYQEIGQPENAAPYNREAYEQAIAAYGPEHHITIRTGVIYSNTLRQVGRLDEARPYAEQAYKMAMAELPRSHPATDTALTEMGQLEIAAGNFAQAEAYLLELLDIEREHLGVAHMYTIGTELKLATAVAGQGRIDEGIDIVQRAIDMMHETQGPDHQETYLAEKQLAALKFEAGRYDEANALLERVLPGLEEHFGNEARQVLETRELKAEVEARL
jgi:serine/threonine-protein kinase